MVGPESERLVRSWAARDAHAHEAALAELRAAADTDQNLVPLIMEAVRADATVGEVTACLQDAWGTYAETPQL